MGEGEFCVAVLSNGGMDNDKIPPKRDHQWLSGSSDDVEPLAKKHAKELLDDVELETCDGNRVNEDTDDVEREVCDGDRPSEAVDDITKPGTSVTNGAVNESQAETCDSVMNAAPDDIEVEACAGDQASEAPPDGIIKPDTSDVEPLAKKHVKELLDDIELETCDENRVNKDTDDAEQEVCDGDRPNEAPDDITKPGTSVTNGAPNASQAETCDSDMNAAPDDIELEACAGDHATEVPLDSIIKPDTSDTNGAPNDSQAETCNRERNEAPGDIELEDCDGDLASGAPVDTIKPDTSDANEAPLDSQAETCNRGMNEAPDDIELEDRDGDLASEVPVDIIKPDTYDNNGVPNDSQAETCNRGMNEALGDVELEACGGDQESEGQNDIIKPDTSDTNLDPNDSQAETCNRDKNGALNDIELEACCGDQVSEGTDHVEPETCHIIEPDTSYVNLNAQAETCNGDQSETTNDIELENCDGGQTNEGPNHIEPETLYGDQANETPLDIKTRTCEEVDDALNDIVPETCDENPLNEASNHIGPETFDGEQINEGSKNIELKSCAEQPANEYSNEMELEPSIKKLVKETSNDDICSEVSNPNLSPRGNASSFQTVSSLSAVELPRSNHGAFGEISSTCSRSDSGEASASEEEHGTDSTSDAISASHVVLEIPKHASTSGIRKITFKFSKRKEDYENQLSAIKPLTDDFDDGVFSAPRLTLSTPDDNYRQGWHETGRASTEVTVPGKNISDNYPTNVKKLLATRILDGARVKYISVSGDKELSGIVSNCGYLCGCSTCNFSKIVSAHEFEQHAGGKTRHPNNHIYLENGKPIYNIIQEIKTAPLGILDEVIRNVAGSSVNEEFLQLWKASLQTNLDMTKSEKSYHMKLMDVYHSRTSRITEDHYSPTSSYIKNIRSEPFTFKESPKERKRLVKKPKTYVSSTVAQKRSSEGGHKKRDNDLHRLLFMPNGLPDGTDLAYYARGQKILGGYKQGNGIVCSHCDTEISPSQFEAHAGWAAKRQPYRHIYTSSGLTLHDIALSLASGQSMETTNSDDMCAVCGDGGRLIFCDGCPRAFHAVCLGLESFPTEKWHCPYCRDNLGPGRKAVLDSRPLVIRLTRVVKAREYETGGCVVCRAHDFSVDKFDERTVMLCDQCEKEYHVGCLRDSGLCDLKALPSEKWFCSKDCNLIHGVMQDLVAKGSQVVSASVSNAINKKYREKGLPDIDPNDIRWRILSGRSRYHEHLPLLSRAAAIFRECFDPIIAASGRDLIPVMVYGRNISGQEFGGIFCVVLIVNSVVVSAGLLRIFGRRVAELPLVATSRQYQGKGYFQALFSSIEELLRSLNVENLVLPAAEEAESIWTKKLGFRRMSDERYFQYSRDNQLTIFKGTSMLEKELQHMAE